MTTPSLLRWLHYCGDIASAPLLLLPGVNLFLSASSSDFPLFFNPLGLSFPPPSPYFLPLSLASPPSPSFSCTFFLLLASSSVSCHARLVQGVSCEVLLFVRASLSLSALHTLPVCPEYFFSCLSLSCFTETGKEITRKQRRGRLLS